jgi:hypothetical protein
MTIVLVISPALDPDGRHAVGGRGAFFDAKIEDRVVVTRTTQPLLDACRRLVAEGIDPDTRIVMRHTGSKANALLAEVGIAAKLTVNEYGDGRSPPKFVAWDGQDPLVAGGSIALEHQPTPEIA